MHSLSTLEPLVANVVVNAWQDSGFRSRLLAAPYDVLKEAGLVFTEPMAVQVLENTAERVHVVLPPQPSGDLLYRMPGRSALWSRIVARAWCDPAFKQRLLSAPATTLAAEGLKIPQGVDLRIYENDDRLFHLVLPPPPDETLADEFLEQVAAGTGDLALWMLPPWL